ncbi:hypothetical protein GLOIN_2v1787791 [Rhizophagus irregularis DAOM 181602=DAOM 197198]|uniref:Uncharacterized protein n=1 Tax=Rhizophagus irregularis (strain DAOM 181602 / DAOM 197198 / MUCL 43194) TaxID=747089 RepID=A0A2P4P547_RHIID|nr:hypothetical protein GLOIN_2v1787791 [Rhizophagus irregularis DAOM 181602=DAOM 197198]POG60516.1 hypothetical protein GLOIN_2v1787791 [Rhizophagus irregularis DAOM 181602=DAOM 197198]|eukprot:XP_025167382.1 hypothetical protein GLOIN_2v1787791 [Rhizophagus irregularis DAOM 181602=DAOM 197198]
MSGENARVISGAEVEAAAEKQELAEFKKAFSDYPDFHVILGPPSSGKTALVHEAYDFLIHIYCLGLHNLYVTTYVIGDLSKEEAEEYFEKHILSQNGTPSEPGIQRNKHFLDLEFGETVGRLSDLEFGETDHSFGT